MRTITFYSFKGGVGRTMALVNVAAELVKRGRKVLVVDFDLEAPGLETYKQLAPKKAHPGIVEYVSKFINERQIPELLDYIYEPDAMTEYKGKLSVMPAGRRDVTYRQQLIKLDWRRFYLEGDGFRFFEETKAYWNELGFDYVLIDSRTGDTDVLGICTRQLPDSVVILFVPNEQNRAGLEHVCRDIRREFEGLPKKTLHFVAANVPNLDDEDDFLRDQIKMFKKDLKFRRLSAVIRRYESLELLDQSVVVLERQHSRLAKAYQRLTETLMKENFRNDPDGAFLFLEDRIQEKLPRIDKEAAKAQQLGMSVHQNKASTRDSHGKRSRVEKTDPLNEIVGQFDDTKILNKAAECWIVEGDIRSAIKVLDRSLKVDPTQDAALLWRGRCKKKLNLINEAADDLVRSIALVPASPESIRLNTIRGDLQNAICELRDIAPNRLDEVADMLCAHELDFDTCIWITDYLLETEDGLPAAAKLLKNQLKKQGVQSEHLLELVLLLAKAKCWREIVELYEKHSANDFQPRGSFSVAIAHWAQSGKMPREICEAAVRTSDWWAEESIWLHWGANQHAEALKCLEQAERIAKDYAQGLIEADGVWGEMYPWSLKNLSDSEPYSTEKYLEECQKLRRFIQGETADLPPFLRPSTE